MSLNDAMTDIVNAFCTKTGVTDKLVTVTYHVPTGTNAKSLSISIITDSDGLRNANLIYPGQTLLY